MSIQVIQQRLEKYEAINAREEENAVKEVAQEICLAGLSRVGFFKEAAFQGGTCLRILYALQRFSEDLDFILKSPNPKFSMEPFLKGLKEETKVYGFQLEIKDRSKVDQTVKKAFLKSDSWGKVLEFQHWKPSRGGTPEKISIKMEVDTNPPSGSEFQEKALVFPFPFTVLTQDLPTLFAGKSHALLCREYVKGRDWYDFLWYERMKVVPNYDFLSNALYQVGPWEGKKIEVNATWFLDKMRTQIRSVNWDEAKGDVDRFMREHERRSLELWSTDFFLERLENMNLETN